MIYSRTGGDRIYAIFLGASEAQIQWGGNDDPNLVCKVGEKYEVERQEVHSYHTKYTLVGIKGKFNSVSFKIVGE